MVQLKISGKDYPCRVTMGALLRFQRETGKDVSKMDSGNMAETVMLLWCCIVSACHADGVPFEMSMEDLADRLEPATLNVFYEDMAASQKKTVTQTTAKKAR